jgi:hypothetical protein
MTYFGSVPPDAPLLPTACPLLDREFCTLCSSGCRDFVNIMIPNVSEKCNLYFSEWNYDQAG